MKQDSSTSAVPCLTIAYHPHPRRVGDRFLLTSLARGGSVEVSRAEPQFVEPERERSESLADRNVSRKPLVIDAGPNDGEVCVNTEETRTVVIADGAEIQGERIFSPDEIRNGVVLELADRVILLLHEYTPSEENSPVIEELVGSSSAFEKVRRGVARLAGDKVPLILRGKKGTNPARIGQEIHRTGQRTGRFVNIDVEGALERQQNLRDVLLGGGIGSRDSEGALRRATYGTLFLTHAEKAPQNVQELLLHVLDHEEIPSDGHAEPIDLRIMGGSFADGDLTGPLLDRMTPNTLDLPLLCDRRDDIGRLILLFLRKELMVIGDAKRVDASTDMTKWLPPDVVGKMLRYDWPGDIEELAEVVHQMALTARGTDPMVLGAGIDELLG